MIASGFDYAIAPRDDAAEIVARVVVDPDHHYRSVYATLLGSLTDPVALDLIREASQRIAESSYELTTIRRPLGDPAR